MSSIHLHGDFHVPNEYKAHGLRVYTPDAYDYDYGSDRRFPVLYMHDGQNIFAHHASARFDTWCANWTMDKILYEQRIEPWIVVGIDHSEDRFGEYSPWDEPQLGYPGRGRGYAQYVVEHVKPFIDRTYRTRTESQWTAAAGASLGGLISLYLHYEYPDVFGRAGGISPSVMWAEGRIFSHWATNHRRWSRIYMDVGEHEFVQWDRLPMDYAGATRAFYEHLVGLGYGPHEVRLVMEPGGAHHETDWARRLPEALAWLLG